MPRASAVERIAESATVNFSSTLSECFISPNSFLDLLLIQRSHRVPRVRPEGQSILPLLPVLQGCWALLSPGQCCVIARIATSQPGEPITPSLPPASPALLGGQAALTCVSGPCA